MYSSQNGADWLKCQPSHQPSPGLKKFRRQQRGRLKADSGMP
jgi:hypothetical protein